MTTTTKKKKRKKEKKRQRHLNGGGREDARRRARASLEDAQAKARGAFDQALKRLESKASSQLHEIVKGSADDATAVTSAMRDVLALTEAASSDALGEMKASRQELHKRLAQVFEQTEGLRASVEQARASTNAAAIEFDASGKAQLKEMVAWREKELGRLLADATDRVSALSAHLEEQTATVDDKVNRLRMTTTRELESILSDTALHRAAAEKLLAASDAAADGIADADQRSQAHASEFGGRLTELGSQAEAQLTEAAQHFEEQIRAREQTLDRIVAESADRLAGSQRALDQSGHQIHEQAAKHFAELLVEGDRDAQELQTIARTRMEEALAVVDQQAVATLGRAAERATELLGETEDHEHAVKAQRARCESLADSMMEHAQIATVSVAEAGEALQLIRSRAVIADTFITRLSEEVERARRLVDTLQDGTVGDRDVSDSDAAGPDEDAEPEPTRSCDTGEDHAANPVNEAPPNEAASDERRDSRHPGDDMVDDAEPYVEDFFSRIATEFVTEVGGEQPSGDERGQATPMPVSAAMPHAPRGASGLETRGYRAGTALATLSVSVLVPASSLKASFQELEESAAGSSVRLEVHHAESGAPEDTCTLRLVTYDPAGWWEYADVSVRSDGPTAPSAVVALGELRDALEATDRFAGGADVRILFDDDVTIGNHLLMVLDGESVPSFPEDRELVERVQLSAADRSGAVLETQVGRLYVPSQLLTHLRRRHAATTDLIVVSGVPCLSARLSDSPANPGLIVIAPLKELGEHDDPMLHERRDKPGNEVAQLVAALSATSTPGELERILKVGVGYARRKAAAHPALQPELIHDLICEGTEVMRAAAAANPSISADDADRATADASPVVRAAVAANASIPPEGLTQLASDPVASVRAQVASNTVAPQELLDRLAADPDSFVRGVVASQKNVPFETLLVLARDPELTVCAAVADNPICPTEVLHDLISLVPDSVLANPNAPRNLLVAGSIVDAPRLRAAVAGNPATPTKSLRKLARDTDPDVLRAVAAHPGAPPNVRRRARRKLETPSGHG